MFKQLNRKSLLMSAAFLTGTTVMNSSSAEATTNNFSKISENITTSIQEVPGMLTGISYLIGILIGILGILKIKDHVENPQQTPLKDGAIRLAAGGALFALPIVYEAMFQTIDNTSGSTGAIVAKVNKVSFGTN